MLTGKVLQSTEVIAASYICNRYIITGLSTYKQKCKTSTSHRTLNLIPEEQSCTHLREDHVGMEAEVAERKPAVLGPPPGGCKGKERTLS